MYFLIDFLIIIYLGDRLNKKLKKINFFEFLTSMSNNAHR